MCTHGCLCPLPAINDQDWPKQRNMINSPEYHSLPLLPCAQRRPRGPNHFLAKGKVRLSQWTDRDAAGHRKIVRSVVACYNAKYIKNSINSKYAIWEAHANVRIRTPTGIGEGSNIDQEQKGMKVSSTACVLFPIPLSSRCPGIRGKIIVQGTGVAPGDYNPGSLKNDSFSLQNPILNQNLGPGVLLSLELFRFVSPREGRWLLPLTDKRSQGRTWKVVNIKQGPRSLYPP